MDVYLSFVVFAKVCNFIFITWPELKPTWSNQHPAQSDVQQAPNNNLKIHEWINGSSKGRQLNYGGKNQED